MRGGRSQIVVSELVKEKVRNSSNLTYFEVHVNTLSQNLFDLNSERTSICISLVFIVDYVAALLVLCVI